MSDHAQAGERIDLWLDIACLFKTRSEAQRACRGGKVDVNGEAARPNRIVRPGDQIVITRGAGRRQTVIVRGVASQHVPKAEARALYEDRTPAPTPEQLEVRDFERAFRAANPATTPDRRDRRLLRRLRGRSD
jgi:ribosome-associated heat shock protein Hsp15